MLSVIKLLVEILISFLKWASIHIKVRLCLLLSCVSFIRPLGLSGRGEEEEGENWSDPAGPIACSHCRIRQWFLGTGQSPADYRIFQAPATLKEHTDLGIGACTLRKMAEGLWPDIPQEHPS